MKWVGSADFFNVCELASVCPAYTDQKLRLLEELSKHLLMAVELGREYEEFKHAISIG